MSTKISGAHYAMMYGPTTGDRVRLADTSLVIEVEKDYTVYGDECKFGGGKTLRDGMGQSVKTTSADGDLDLVITNALVLDCTGIYKADIGIKDSRIAGIGKAGNPAVMDDSGRHRHPYSFYLSPADRLRALQRSYHNDRRGHRSRRRHQRNDLYARTMESRADAAGSGGISDEYRPAGKRQLLR